MGLILLEDSFESPEKKIDKLLGRSDKKLVVPKSEGLKKIYDNLKFSEEVKTNPLLLKKEYRGFDAKVINLSSFLNLRLYPRSIYTTDKLLRLVGSSRLEQLKKHLSKKRTMPINFLWIIFIIMGVIIAVIVILVLLPKFGVGG